MTTTDFAIIYRETPTGRDLVWDVHTTREAAETDLRDALRGGFIDNARIVTRRYHH